MEEGFEAVSQPQTAHENAVAAIFDGEKEAKLIALACSEPPRGAPAGRCACWESKVVELGIVAAQRRNDRTHTQKLSQAASQAMLGHPAKADSAFVAAMEDGSRV